MMAERSVYLDSALCDGCGICVRICPARAFSLEEGRAVFTGECTLACDHCAAACPRQAIEVAIEKPEAFVFENFSPFSASRAAAPVEIGRLAALMRQRRSCRVYRDRPVPLSLLKDLVRIALTAPSGTNSQALGFTILPEREKLLEFGRAIARFYEELNRLAEKAWLRRGLKLCRRPELDLYYREYYNSVKEALRSWQEGSDDRLFHGAPAAILVSSRPGASCPVEDALLAAGNMILASEALGLGSCLIGFAVEALRRDKRIRKLLEIPATEKVHAVLVLGYPAITFQRPAARPQAPVRVVY